MHAFVRFIPLLLAAAGGLALAQATAPTQDLPKDLHGRWTAGAAGAATQPFDLENIERQNDGSFKARLSWTGSDPKCTIRYQPVTGRVTTTGLSFDAVTPCKEAVHAELARGAAGAWVGQASTKATPPALLQLTAK